MDKLPDSLLLQILSRLDDSADVARCRVASKAFDNVFPHLRSINLRCSNNWYLVNSTFKAVFLDLVSKLKTVESVYIGHEKPGFDDGEKDDMYLFDGDFGNKWLPRVSETLKSLSISGLNCHRRLHSNVLPLISAHCHNLHTLKLKFAWLSVENLNPMPMLTSLTLALSTLDDQRLDELNKCFPNLQVLNFVGIEGLKDPKIHLLNLQTCHWSIYHAPSLTLITPNLITLKIEYLYPAAIHLEAPMLSHFHLSITILKHASAFTVKKFENLKTLCLECLYVACFLSGFPITKTVENLTLNSGWKIPIYGGYSKLTLRKVFTIFPNVSSLRINSATWSEFEACSNSEGWEILDGRKGLKTICVYLTLVDPSLTFSSVACVLDQCVGLSEVSLLIHDDVVDTESKSFMSKCMARWSGLKWRWGVWNTDDYWTTNAISS